MLRELTMNQLVEWLAYSEMEPFDETRADVRAASIASAVWNAAVWTQSTREHPFRELPLDRFVLKFDEAVGARERTQTWQEQKQMAELWVRAYNSEAG